MAVKQVFETYVYDLGMSSVTRMPFVMMWINGAHGDACGKTPRDLRSLEVRAGKTDQMWELACLRCRRRCTSVIPRGSDRRQASSYIKAKLAYRQRED
jgi:hypothetical protein